VLWGPTEDSQEGIFALELKIVSFWDLFREPGLARKE
jgi:hypothetical protein